MARQAGRVGREDHCPGHVGDPAPQLGVDEVRKPAEQHPHRHADRHVVDHPDEVQLVAPCDPRHRQRHPRKPAVEAHPPVPQAQQLPRDEALAREVGEGARDAGLPAGVEQRVADAPAENHPERAVEEQVVGMALRHRRAGGLERPRGVPIGEDHPQEVGQRVEPQGEEPQFDARLQPQVGPLDRIGGAACGSK